jgi:hypothetical protein
MLMKHSPSHHIRIMSKAFMQVLDQEKRTIKLFVVWFTLLLLLLTFELNITIILIYNKKNSYFFI